MRKQSDREHGPKPNADSLPLWARQGPRPSNAQQQVGFNLRTMFAAPRALLSNEGAAGAHRGVGLRAPARSTSSE